MKITIDPSNQAPIPKGYYVRMPHRRATFVAMNALLDHEAYFEVKSSGPTGSIIVYSTRSLDILKQVERHYQPGRFKKWLDTHLGLILRIIWRGRLRFVPHFA